MTKTFYQIENREFARILRLISADGMLSRYRVVALTDAVRELTIQPQALIICGVPIFSVGADLNEIAELNGPEALQFAKIGQELMSAIAGYPAVVYAAIQGYCMGGGLDLALACHRRIASPHTTFGHRGAALGLMTGWGGTQRLPRLVGKAKALEMFIAAEKIHAKQALQVGLVDAIADDPVEQAISELRAARRSVALSRSADIP